MSVFRVVLADLDALKTGLSQGASEYEQLIASINPPAVDGGEGNLNSVMQALVETFDVAHHNLVDSMRHYANTVKAARDTFEQTDSGAYFAFDGTRSLYDNMVPKEAQ